MAEVPPIRIERRGPVAILTLDHPPVNTLTRPVRRCLYTALVELERDPGVKALVIAGRTHFSAGADLTEFDSGQGLAEPTLHLTIAGHLDTSRLPSVAAVSGVALGGGLELALACSARIARSDARLGLPETTLGFMPGAGGTQRLPRAVGAEAALDLITTGRTIDGAAAAAVNLVDELADDPVAAAISVAEALADATRLRRRLRDEATAPTAPAVFDLALRDARRVQAPAGVRYAIEAMRTGAADGFDEGLRSELALFRELADTPQARAARYRFLSERRLGEGGRGAVLPSSVAVVGAGTMGRGIAQAFLSAGFPVTLVDTDEDRVEAGRSAILASLDAAVVKGRLPGDARDEQSERLTAGIGTGAVADADLVVEAVFEDLEVKQILFAELDQIARPGAILASNTSSLDLDAIAAVTQRPDKVVGLHFFSPANIMRLVEVVAGARTSPATLAIALAVVGRLRKLPVVSQVAPGFIGNRVFDAYLRQANLLLGDGASPARVDTALEQWGMAMGPFRVLDLVGNDVPAAARRARGENDHAWALADRIADAGWFGRKSGAGWYRYDGDPVENPDVLALLPDVDDTPSDVDIVERCIRAIVNEAIAVLEDGVAASDRDIDTVMVHGYGFPADRGGPLQWAGEQGWYRTSVALERLRRETGDEFWAPRPTVGRRAAQEVAA